MYVNIRTERAETVAHAWDRCLGKACMYVCMHVRNMCTESVDTVAEAWDRCLGKACVYVCMYVCTEICVQKVLKLWQRPGIDA